MTTFLIAVVCLAICGFIGYAFGHTSGESEGYSRARSIYAPAPRKLPVKPEAVEVATHKAKKAAKVAKTTKVVPAPKEVAKAKKIGRPRKQA